MEHIKCIHLYIQQGIYIIYIFILDLSLTHIVFIIILNNTLIEFTNILFFQMHSFYGTTGDMSMSADATCQGLQSPSLGVLTMKLSKGNVLFNFMFYVYSHIL